MTSLTQRTLSRRMLAAAAIASLSFGALAQEAARQVAPGAGLPVGKMLVLPCCHCLGDQTKLDLSTGSAPWMVVGGANAVVLGTPPAAWGSLPPAKWVGINASSGASGAAGTTTYQVSFMRPKCVIPSKSITISGQFLADNKATITASGPGVSGGSFSTPAAATVYGFTNANMVPFSFTATGPGLVTLSVKVFNESGPTGLLVRAAVVKQCVREDGAIPMELPADKKE